MYFHRDAVILHWLKLSYYFLGQLIGYSKRLGKNGPIHHQLFICICGNNEEVMTIEISSRTNKTDPSLPKKDMFVGQSGKKGGKKE